jgi:protein ImuA
MRGLVELKPAGHDDWPATLAFAACLAKRRQLGVLETQGEQEAAGRSASVKPILWCMTPRFAAEHGGLYGAGLAELGLSPCDAILVDAPREANALWALEEGLRSKTLSLAIGLMKEVALTPSRRLGLAAAAGLTPGLLLTLPSSPPAPSASLRLRLRRLSSAPHPFDPRAPGASRVRLTMERCRGASPASEALSFDLEWCDVTYRFRMAAQVADRSFAASSARQRA